LNEHNKFHYAREVVGGDPVARDLGIVVEEVEKERAVLSLTPERRHLNSVDRVHGASIYALTDLAAAVAANTRDQKALILEAKVNFLAAADPGKRLVAEAVPISMGRRISLWEVRVQQGDRLVATTQALAYHRQDDTS
jgi:acyl-CoA thioesterase